MLKPLPNAWGPRPGTTLGLLLLLFWCCIPSTAYSAHSFFQNDVIIRGQIKDNTGTTMPGVNVLLKGSSSGTTTDADGQYSLTIPSSTAQSAILVFSFIGYQSQEQVIGARSVIDITLEPDITQLSEVVVVGYGTQEKRDVTAAISSINKEAISRISTPDPLNAMKGQIAGVDVLQASGRPGQASSITIRGRRSINAGNDPLIVVDGVPMTAGTNPTYRYDAGQGKSVKDDDVPATVGLQDFNPGDIESIEVLKDAAATAIYGSRGANGVILITTKRGKTGKTTISYNGTYGVTQPFRTFPMMNGEQFANFKREANRISPGGITGRTAWEGTIPADNIVFVDPVELNSVQNGLSTDWQDLVFQNGSQTNHQISVNGGSEKTQFNVSLGYFNEEGMIKTMGFKKITARVNLDHQINKFLKIGTSTLLSHSLQERGGANTALDEAVNQTPLGLPYNADGSLKFLPISDGIRSNPLNELVPNKRVDNRNIDRVFSSMYAEVSLLKGLKYKALFGTDMSYNTNGTFEGQFTNSRKNGTPSASYTNEASTGFTLENLLTYNKKFNEVHDFGVTFLQSVQTSKYQRHYTSVADLPYETQKWYNVATTATLVAKETAWRQWQLASFMGRINYAYRGKYLLQVSLRSDGSSRLAPAARWTNFPGVSAGWRVSDEAFMQAIPVINDLKIRGSYGVVGNTAVDPYSTQGKLGITPGSWGKTTSALGLGFLEIPNPKLGWEKSATMNIGADFGLFQSRVSGSVEYFVTNTTDLLLKQNLPGSSAYSFILSNIGATKTNGFEVNLNTAVLDLPSGFKWNIDFNVAHYKEQIVDLSQRDANGNKADDTGNSWFIGYPIKVYYQYNKIGLWQKNEFEAAQKMDKAYPGEIKVEDYDGDGVITPADRRILGTDVPKAYGGITNRFSFKGIDLAVFFYYRLGFMIDSRFEDSQATMQARYNNLNVDYWTIDNPSNAYPRPNKNQEFPQRRETLRYRQGGFVKLRNVTLGYNFPKSVTERLGITSFRFYVTGQNLLAWSKYKVWDPETVNQVETGDIPPAKLWLGGVNISF
jgi:TonB-linked SusC/RagA family outer membrane protein